MKEESKRRAVRGNSVDNKYAAGSERPAGVHANTMSQPREFIGYDDMEERIQNGETPLNPSGRNKRTVWTVSTKSYSGAHFATFPPDLIEPCIKAGTSEKGACPECGAPFVRHADREIVPGPKAAKTFVIDERDSHPLASNDQGSNRARSGHKSGYITAVTNSKWYPSCKHWWAIPVPCRVFDPFGGSGTTAMVARNLGRIGVNTELSWEYLQLERERLGMKAMDEFYNGRKAEPNIEGLPMFT